MPKQVCLKVTIHRMTTLRDIIFFKIPAVKGSRISFAKSAIFRLNAWVNAFSSSFTHDITTGTEVDSDHTLVLLNERFFRQFH